MSAKGLRPSSQPRRKPLRVRSERDVSRERPQDTDRHSLGARESRRRHCAHCGTSYWVWGDAAWARPGAHGRPAAVCTHGPASSLSVGGGAAAPCSARGSGSALEAA